MRDKLAELAGTKRALYFGTVDRTKMRPTNGGFVCLTEVYREDGEEMTDHVWLTEVNSLKGRRYLDGDLVSFTATIKQYKRKKNYKWTVDGEEVSTDYGFADIRDVKVVSKEG